MSSQRIKFGYYLKLTIGYINRLREPKRKKIEIREIYLGMLGIN